MNNVHIFCPCKEMIYYYTWRYIGAQVTACKNDKLNLTSMNKRNPFPCETLPINGDKLNSSLWK